MHQFIKNVTIMTEEMLDTFSTMNTNH